MSLMKLLCGFFSGVCRCEPGVSNPGPKTTASSAATDVQPNMAAQTAPPAPPESEEIATPS